MYCGNCSSGWVKVGNGYNRCECIRDRIVENKFNESTTPESFYKFKEDLEDQKSFTILKKEIGYIDIINELTSNEAKEELFKKNMTIVLKGNAGSGKTQLATTLALELVRRFNLYEKELKTKDFYFLRMASFKDLVFKDEDKKEIIKKVRNSDVLIIDDLGTENYNNTWTMERLSEVLREFDGVKIITTNMTKTDIHSFYKDKDARLSDVLVNSTEDKHAENNCLFYLIGKKESRRVQKVKQNLFT